MFLRRRQQNFSLSKIFPITANGQNGCNFLYNKNWLPLKEVLTHKAKNICDYMISKMITITAVYLLAVLNKKGFLQLRMVRDLGKWKFICKELQLICKE